MSGGESYVASASRTEPTIDDPQVLERTVLANARRICKREYQRSSNWVLAMNVFGLGSTWAYELCRRIGVNPDGRTMEPFQPVRKLADANQKETP